VVVVAVVVVVVVVAALVVVVAILVGFPLASSLARPLGDGLFLGPTHPHGEIRFRGMMARSQIHLLRVVADMPRNPFSVWFRWCIILAIARVAPACLFLPVFAAFVYHEAVHAW
jgi:hypothetical protein